MTDDVETGRVAWARLRGRQKKNWADWLAVGAALVIGRMACLKIAKANRPVGSIYNRAMAQWLRDNGFDEISTQERYRAILCVENSAAIEAWRSTLDEATQRRFNHPNAVWQAWRRSTKQPTRREHVTNIAKNGKGYGRPVYWPSDAIKRAAEAMRESRSTDWLILARRALEAGVRNDDDIAALLPQPKRRHQEVNDTVILHGLDVYA